MNRVNRFPLRRTRRCVDCGFLTIGGRLVNGSARTLIESKQSGVLPADLDELTCARGLWIAEDLSNAIDIELLEAANVQRKCRYFCEYIPGFSPELHREHVVRIEERRAERLWNVLFVLLGAATAILGSCLERTWR